MGVDGEVGGCEEIDVGSSMMSALSLAQQGCITEED